MARHPADPRSDALGEQKYLESEYPHHEYSPPPMPPEPGNVHNFIPQRGQVQHGVQIDRRPEAVGLPYAGEQAVLDDYNDPNVTPVRDIHPPVPVPVSIVETPDLTRRIKGRASTTYIAPDGVFRRVIGPDHFRTRLIISAQADDSSQNLTYYWSHTADTVTANAIRQFYPQFTNGATLIDTEMTQGLFIMVPAGSATGIRAQIWTEYRMLDGESLLA